MIYKEEFKAVQIKADWTMLLNEQCCSLLFQQRCSALMKQQQLFTVVGTRENNIDRTSLFVIVIIVVQPC